MAVLRIMRRGYKNIKFFEKWEEGRVMASFSIKWRGYNNGKFLK